MCYLTLRLTVNGTVGYLPSNIDNSNWFYTVVRDQFFLTNYNIMYNSQICYNIWNYFVLNNILNSFVLNGLIYRYYRLKITYSMSLIYCMWIYKINKNVMYLKFICDLQPVLTIIFINVHDDGEY